MRVLGLGDNIIDRFIDRQVDYPGGNAVNVAVFARRHGAESAYLGVFGDDELAGFLRGCLEAEGVDTSRSQVKHGATGISRLHVIDSERVFLGWNGGGVTVSDPLELDAELLAYVSGFDLAHSSVYSGLESQLAALRETNTLVSFDFSSEPEYRSADYLARVAPAVDLALVSCGELPPEQADELLRSIHAAGAPLVLGTCGTAGSRLFDGTQILTHPAHLHQDLTQLRDTMGCGDAALAGFATSLLADGWSRRQRPTLEALRRGLERAAEAAKVQCTVEAAFAHPRSWRDETLPVR
ncbi:fructosamine kinase FrlD [Glutamicibacter endophyticus]